jgi:hypothetical protein
LCDQTPVINDAKVMGVKKDERTDLPTYTHKRDLIQFDFLSKEKLKPFYLMLWQ